MGTREARGARAARRFEPRSRRRSIAAAHLARAVAVEHTSPVVREAVGHVGRRIHADAPARIVTGEGATHERGVGRAGEDPRCRDPTAADDDAERVDALPLAVVGVRRKGLRAVIVGAHERATTHAPRRAVRGCWLLAAGGDEEPERDGNEPEATQRQSGLSDQRQVTIEVHSPTEV